MRAHTKPFRFWNNQTPGKDPVPCQIYGPLYYVGSRQFCAYALDTQDGLLLFDTMDKPSERLLARNVQKLGFSIKNVRWIFNTHYHFDHVGGNAMVMDRSHATMFIHKKELKLLNIGLGPGRFSKKHRVRPLRGSEILECGPIRVRVVFTPGQSMGSCCFFTEIDGPQGKKRVLVMGDASGFKSNKREMRLYGYHGTDKDYMKTIRKMKQFVFDLVLPGHAHQISLETRRDGSPWITRKEWLSFLNHRLAEMKSFVAEYPDFNQLIHS